MRKIAISLSLLVLVCFMAVGINACAPAVNYDVDAIRDYADPATETTLQGFSEGNMAKYTQYGNAGFKEAVTQKLFDEMVLQIENQFGTYVSQEFMKVGEKDNYILVYYKAKYTRGDVTVRMVFDQDHLVAGQWFE
jgi:hypothetical protein